MIEEERRAELRLFLKERRARVSPTDVGIPTTSRRRVRGLRREEVASLAGIGVSWYTELENGNAQGVSETTVLAVAKALRLSDSELHYLLHLTGRSEVLEESSPPGPLTLAAMHAMRFPAYLITSLWEVLDCNEIFCRIWNIDRRELPFNAIGRLFMHPQARKMHATYFEENITPVIGMFRSSQGRQLNSIALQQLRDQLMEDEIVRKIWHSFDILSPLIPNACTIESPLGTFRYEALTLPIPGFLHGIVVQVPDAQSEKLL